MKSLKFILAGAAFCGLVAPLANPAMAQNSEFKAKQIRLIIANAAGGDEYYAFYSMLLGAEL